MESNNFFFQQSYPDNPSNQVSIPLTTFPDHPNQGNYHNQTHIINNTPSSDALSHSQPIYDPLLYYNDEFTQEALEVAQFNANPPFFLPLYTSFGKHVNLFKHFPFSMNPIQNPIDHTSYPKSSQLYEELCNTFGAHNIASVPQFLSDTSDRSRKQWYKSGPNALLYFLYRSPKYKARMQKIMDAGICANGCCYTKPAYAGNIYSFIEPEFCTMFCKDMPLLLNPVGGTCSYPFICEGSPALHRRYYAWDPIPFDSTWGNTCGLMYRYNILQNLQQSGINTCLVPKCCVLCQFSLCSPCIDMNTEAILSYYFHKRHGFQLHSTFPGKIAIKKHVYDDGQHIWEQFYKAAWEWAITIKSPHLTQVSPKTEPQQPQPKNALPYFLWSSSNGALRDKPESFFYQSYMARYSREHLINNEAISHQYFSEWFDPYAAVAKHNTEWDSVHFIHLPPLFFDKKLPSSASPAFSATRRQTHYQQCASAPALNELIMK